jgi:hypothetical protein
MKGKVSTFNEGRVAHKATRRGSTKSSRAPKTRQRSSSALAVLRRFKFSGDALNLSDTNAKLGGEAPSLGEIRHQ